MRAATTTTVTIAAGSTAAGTRVVLRWSWTKQPSLIRGGTTAAGIGDLKLSSDVCRDFSCQVMSTM